MFWPRRLGTVHCDPRREPRPQPYKRRTGRRAAWSCMASPPTAKRRLLAVVPVCGALPGDSDRAAQRLKDLSIWVFHAADDSAMPVELGDGAVAAMNRAARREPARYTRYRRAPPPPDPQYNDMVGHASYDLAFRDASLYAWLAAQHRRGAS